MVKKSGDGITDDTAAIIRAITEGRGDDPNAGSSL